MSQFSQFSSLYTTNPVIDKGNLQLDQVDNTSDLNKPISTAIQNALDLKASAGNPAFTGNLTVSGTVNGRNLSADGAKIDNIATNANNYTHPSHATTNINTTGATIVDSITTSVEGHVTAMGTRVLTLTDLGYTGEANATADQTAAEILTLLKTVDTNSSGLNADTLDGQQGSYYAVKSNVYTKAEIAAREVTLISGIDWKEAVTNFADLATTYTSPIEGWTASVNSTDTVYRYNGTAWVALANGTVPLATNAIDGKLSSADFTKLQGIATSANNYTHPTNVTTNINTTGATIVDSITTSADGHITAMSTRVLTLTDLGYTGATNATGALTATEIKTIYESNLDTNAFTDTEKTKLQGIATNANNYTHPSHVTTNINTTGATIVDSITTSADGHITAMGTRVLTLTDLGYTGATNATGALTATEILTLLKTVDTNSSGLNADLLDGYHANSTSAANTVALRNASGDINARLFRSEYDVTNTNIGYIMTQIDTATNNYIRPSTPAQFRAAVTDGSYAPLASPAFTGAITSTVATGTAPFTVASTTKVTNLNADLFDGYNSTTFPKLVSVNTYTAQNVFSATTGLLIETNAQGFAPIEIRQNTVNKDAYMAFHTAGDYAINFGLDGSTDKLSVGGWSMGANVYEIWHAGNQGANTGMDADKLDGLHATSFLRSDSNNTTATGLISTTNAVEAGRTSGSMALTVNDGYGNANLCFNHKNGTPDSNGSSGRISLNVDAVTPSMTFQLAANTTSGVASPASSVLALSTTGATVSGNLTVNGNITATGIVDYGTF